MTYFHYGDRHGLVPFCRYREALRRRDTAHTSLNTAAERAALEGRARKYTSPYRDVIRAKIILLAAEGLRNDVTAARLDTPRQIVSKWRQRFFIERLAGLEEDPRGGQATRFSPQCRRRR
jgi:hypothetical protein